MIKLCHGRPRDLERDTDLRLADRVNRQWLRLDRWVALQQFLLFAVAMLLWGIPLDKLDEELPSKPPLVGMPVGW